MVSRAKSPVYNLAEAKAHLSELVERASAGEIIVVARSGTPRARLVPLEKGRKELRVPGKGEGRFNMNFGSPRSECRSPKRNSSRIGLKPRGGVAAPRRARDSPKAAEGR
ncbi:MAG: type II toxin-antitoxin system prevent-host-death family antitoxin, partial [Polyangiaceae bacterium]|nr:type II toxin-antitoxin system prevent-host-death family antitoxin [Polyangiaceae bacterium]